MGAKILIKLVLEASFSALGAILAPRADKTSKRWVRPPFVPPSWGPTWRLKSTKIGQNRPKMDIFGGQKAILLNKKLKMAKVAPRCPNIALKYMISGLCWLA